MPGFETSAPDPAGSGDDLLRVGGFSPASFADWPGEITATLFCQGCPWDCGYCHNPDLIPAASPGRYGWGQIVSFLHSRLGLLDGVVFSGGEPLLQTHLPEAMLAVRAMGFRIGLHTGGAYPQRLARVLPLVDWIGFDIKAAAPDYDALTRSPGSGRRAMESLRLLQASGVVFETRTTLDPYFFTETRRQRLDTAVAALNLPDHRMQDYRETGTRPRAD